MRDLPGQSEEPGDGAIADDYAGPARALNRHERFELRLMDDPYDVYFSADVETDGPIPGPFSMTSFGLALAGRFDGRQFERTDPRAHTFYRELKPISDAVDEETARVSGLDRDQLMRSGAVPEVAMSEASEWVREVAGRGTPILVAFPLSFDWSFLYWYFVAFSRDGSPFRHSHCLDMKTLYAVRRGTPIALSGASKLPEHIRSGRRHEHQALSDAVEQADVFANLIERT